jgi:hypothetical protein
VEVITAWPLPGRRVSERSGGALRR